MKAERPSRTAELVAAGIICTSRDAKFQQFIDPKAVELSRECLQRSSNLGWLINKCLELPILPRLLDRFADRVVPGLLQHFALRKYIIEKICIEEIKAGADLVCVIGAGFDSLAYRLQSSFPSVGFIEVDHLATQNVKKSALRNLGQLGQIVFAAHDLANEGLEKLLAASMAVAGGKRTVFIIEGLLMYLSEDQVKHLLLTCLTATRGAVTIILTWMEPDADGKIRFQRSSAVADRFLSFSHEEFKWGATAEELKLTAQRTGFAISKTIRTWELADKYDLPPHSVAVGECIGVLSPSHQTSS
jgi:methyltransferase (TIGR00027 family)